MFHIVFLYKPESWASLTHVSLSFCVNKWLRACERSYLYENACLCSCARVRPHVRVNMRVHVRVIDCGVRFIQGEQILRLIKQRPNILIPSYPFHWITKRLTCKRGLNKSTFCTGTCRLERDEQKKLYFANYLLRSTNHSSTFGLIQCIRSVAALLRWLFKLNGNERISLFFVPILTS